MGKETVERGSVGYRKEIWQDVGCALILEGEARAKEDRRDINNAKDN